MLREISNLNFFERCLFLALLIAALFGVFSPLRPNFLNVDTIFELLVVCFSLYCFACSRVSLYQISALIIIGGYIFLSLSYSILMGDHLLDFAQSYKSIYYLFLFCLCLNARVIKSHFIKYLPLFLLPLFFLKYFYSSILSFSPRMAERPAIFVENNYELVFLIGVVFLSWSLLSRKEKAFAYIVLVAVVFLSSSRSAAISLLLASFLMMGVQSISQFIKSFIPIVFVSVIVLLVFWGRGDLSLDQIDRFRFFGVFYSEISNYGFFSFLFGTPRISELSATACQSLSYYHLLFSFSDSRSCYAVIFHSYFMRAIFDHGLIVVVFTIWIYFTQIYRSSRDIRLSASLVGIVSVSGLSVSAFGDYFSALLLMFAVTASSAKLSSKRRGSWATKRSKHQIANFQAD